MSVDPSQLGFNPKDMDLDAEEAGTFFLLLDIICLILHFKFSF